MRVKCLAQEHNTMTRVGLELEAKEVLFFTLKLSKRIGISLSEVYKRVRKTAIYRTVDFRQEQHE